MSGIRYELRLFVPQQFEIRQSSNWCRVAGKSLVADLDLAASNRSSCETMEQHEEIDLTGTTASSNVEDSMITLNLKMCVYMYCTRGNNVLCVDLGSTSFVLCVLASVRTPSIRRVGAGVQVPTWQDSCIFMRSIFLRTHVV